MDFDKHKVKAGSKYDIKLNEIKYGYILENPNRCEPKIAPKGGIVIRNNIKWKGDNTMALTINEMIYKTIIKIWT